MALSHNKPKLDNLADQSGNPPSVCAANSRLTSIKASKFLPIIVIRRLECVLLAWREAILDPPPHLRFVGRKVVLKPRRKRPFFGADLEAVHVNDEPRS
jgi:hypothetical protein